MAVYPAAERRVHKNTKVWIRTHLSCSGGYTNEFNCPCRHVWGAPSKKPSSVDGHCDVNTRQARCQNTQNITKPQSVGVHHETETGRGLIPSSGRPCSEHSWRGLRPHWKHCSHMNTTSKLTSSGVFSEDRHPHDKSLPLHYQLSSDICLAAGQTQSLCRGSDGSACVLI